MVIFIGYLAIVSNMKDIKRVFQYHGAEHKTIACYEAGEELTVENIKKAIQDFIRDAERVSCFSL